MSAIDKVLYTADAMVAAYTSFQNCQHDVEDAILRMTSAVFTLDSSWNGEASEAFKASYNGLKGNLDTSTPSLEKAINDLKTAQATYEDVETTLESLLQAMEEVSDPFAAG